jgi:hypothetical protein
MIIKTFYSNGHFDVFDSEHLTASNLFPGNALTNFNFNLEDVSGQRLWLNLYYYEVAVQYREESGPYGLPVARRRNGWSFLLVDDDDIAGLTKVTADNQLVLFRQGDTLVDGIAYNYASDLAYELNPQSVKTHDYFARVLGVPATGAEAAEAELCHMMGYDAATYAHVAELHRRGTPPQKEKDEGCSRF